MKKPIGIYIVLFVSSLIPLGYLVSKHFIELYNITGFLGIFFLGFIFIGTKKYFLGYCFYCAFVVGLFMEYVYISNGKHTNSAIAMNIKMIVTTLVFGAVVEFIIAFRKKIIHKK